MAGFNVELPNELIKSFQELEANTEEMLSDMTRAGAEVVYKQVKSNMKSSFKSTELQQKKESEVEQ